VSLIGTVNRQGTTNLAIFSNIMHLGADPALVGFINRPLAASPHTIRNIEETGVYSINHIHETMIPAAHQTSAKYAEGESEFDATGLTPVFRDGIAAPFVAESRLQYALHLKEIIPIAFNQTFLVIGAITDVFTDPSTIGEDGFLSLSQLGSVVSVGLDGYSPVSEATRYAYAKPGERPVVLAAEESDQ